MILYDKKGNRVNFNTEDKIGGRTHGNVYKISDTECIKVYKKSSEVDIEILKLIKSLYLRNYYEILELYYSRSNIFKAVKTTYYQKQNIDILTMPTNYTLDNLFNISLSINTLTKNNVLVEDSHSENVIMDSNKITIIDVDLYSFNRFRTAKELKIKNLERLAYLFKEIYTEAITDFHPEYKDCITSALIGEIFNFYTPHHIESTYKKLSKYKYPIDYIKKYREK